MPRVIVAMMTGKPEAYREAVLDAVYTGMCDALALPANDQLITLSEHETSNFRYSDAFGVARSADLIYIQIIVFDTRTPEQKKALFRRLAELFGENPGQRPEDLFVNVYDAPKENWPVGHGLAQFA